MTTSKRKLSPDPEIVIDFESEDKKPDPTRCRCEGVTRRWDIDGLIETKDGVSTYRCSVCGKAYW